MKADKPHVAIQKVDREWGSYVILEDNHNNYLIKRVTVNPGRRLSLQMHHHRSEHWVVVSGVAEVQLDGQSQFLRTGESMFVNSTVKHRLMNPGVTPLEIIEVQIGQYLSENDIIRFDDDWGRHIKKEVFLD